VKLLLLYTLLRLLMFVAAWGVVWTVASFWLEWTRATALLTALIALIISAIASLVLLRTLRERLAARVQRGTGRVQQRYEAAKRREDADGE
jgi:membrane associated rhomboid family serine protease